MDAHGGCAALRSAASKQGGSSVASLVHDLPATSDASASQVNKSAPSCRAAHDKLLILAQLQTKHTSRSRPCPRSTSMHPAGCQSCHKHPIRFCLSAQVLLGANTLTPSSVIDLDRAVVLALRAAVVAPTTLDRPPVRVTTTDAPTVDLVLPSTAPLPPRLDTRPTTTLLTVKEVPLPLREVSKTAQLPKNK